MTPESASPAQVGEASHAAAAPTCPDRSRRGRDKASGPQSADLPSSGPPIRGYDGECSQRNRRTTVVPCPVGREVGSSRCTARGAGPPGPRGCVYLRSGSERAAAHRAGNRLAAAPRDPGSGHEQRAGWGPHSSASSTRCVRPRTATCTSCRWLSLSARDTAYRDYRDRYRAMATELGFEGPIRAAPHGFHQTTYLRGAAGNCQHG